MRPRHMAFAIQLRASRVIRQIVTTIENHPLWIVEMLASVAALMSIPPPYDSSPARERESFSNQANLALILTHRELSIS